MAVGAAQAQKNERNEKVFDGCLCIRTKHVMLVSFRIVRTHPTLLFRLSHINSQLQVGSYFHIFKHCQ